MARFIKGDVVVVPFPFSDLSRAKRRPCLVIANLQGADVILCQITSQNSTDINAISLTNNDFISGGLNRHSFIRPNRLFTADQNIILYKAGQLKTEKTNQVITRIISIIRS